MDRRTVIKNLALVIGGAALLPSCMHKNGMPYVQLKHININADQQGLIGDIAETIIPKTSTPGAKELNLPAFVLKMLDDCYDKKSQQAFMTGLANFESMVKKQYDKPFGDLTNKEKEAVLTGIENDSKAGRQNGKTPARSLKPQKSMPARPVDAFYWTVKQQTIYAYTTSQYFMTKEIVYELIPGRYNAHFPVKNIKTA